MKKRLISFVLAFALVAGTGFIGFLYFRFVSRTIYSESTAHLKEIF